MQDAQRSTAVPRSHPSIRPPTSPVSWLLVPVAVGCLGGCGFHGDTSGSAYTKRYIFVTSNHYPGNKFSTQNAHNICHSLAQNTTDQNSPLRQVNQWRAWITYYDASFSPMKIGEAYNGLQYALNQYGTRNSSWYTTKALSTSSPVAVFNNLESILGGTRGNSLANYTENGEQVPDGTVVWTGTSLNGTTATVYENGAQTSRSNLVLCGDKDLVSWNTIDATASGVVGLINGTGKDWTEYRQMNCSMEAHLICFEICRKNELNCEPQAF